MSVKAVVFDLDDTLFPESDYVESGFKAVAEYAEKTLGLDGAYAELTELFERDRARVFDRFAADHGLDGTTAAQLTELYRDHKPELTLADDVKETLAKLRADGFKLGIITDGRPRGQRNKIAALGLETMVDKITITDELGGAEFRKPDPKAFELMCKELGVAPDEMMYVGDNPQKDFAIGRTGIVTVRIVNDGLYNDRDYLDGIAPYRTINNIRELRKVMEEHDVISQMDVIKERLLHIMDFIHDVCAKENIMYSLSGGTLIGAVRHKGFIPWDDDIDITMSRADFERFAQVIDGYCERSGEFELKRKTLRVPTIGYKQAPIIDGYKYEGIKIDIFILDNFPNEPKKRKRLIFKLRMLQGMMRKDKIEWSKYSLKGKVLLFGTKTLGLLRTKKGLIKSYNKLSVKYNGQKTHDKFISNDLYAVMDIPYDGEWVNRVISAQYEDRQYFIFEDYDPFLRVRYGEYMTLPPESERKPSHDIVVTRIDER